MIDVTLFAALLAGMLSFASPCILPLVPPYLAYIGGVQLSELTERTDQSANARQGVVGAALFFVFGFSAMFTGLGAGASQIGHLLNDYFDTLRIAAGALLVLYGLSFLGLFRLAALQAAYNAPAPRPIGVGRTVLFGAAFALGWSPCAGPILAAILFEASAAGEPARGAVLLLVYSLGLGLPFLAAALFFGWFIRLLKKARGVLRYFEPAVGVILIGTGGLYLTNQMTRIGVWMSTYIPTLEGLSGDGHIHIFNFLFAFSNTFAHA